MIPLLRRRWLGPLLVTGFSLLPAAVQAQVTNKVTLKTNDLVYVAATGRLYASVPSSDPVYGNSVVAIDPVTGSIAASLVVGSQPNRLAASDDGSSLYVGLDGANAVRVVHLDTFTAGLQFTLTNWGCSYSLPTARALAVQPGNAAVVAIAHGCDSSGLSGQGIAIYEDGVMRSAVASNSQAELTLTFGASPSTLYANDNSWSRSTFSRLRVDAGGVTLVDSVSDVLPGTVEKISFAAGRIYGGSGVVDPDLPAPTGRLGGDAYSTTVDPARGLAFVLGSNPSNADSRLITAFDTSTFLPRWSVEVSTGLLYANWSLVQAGTDRFAFRGLDGVFMVDARAAAATTHLQLRVDKNGTGTGVVRSSVGGIICGTACQAVLPAGTEMTLSATPDTGSIFAGWTGNEDCADGTVTLTSAMACTAAFTRADGGPSVRRIALKARHLLYAPSSGLLYASLSSANGAGGNSVTTIDPVTGSVGPPLWVGSEPSRLAMSDDGQVLYVGLDGALSAARVQTAAKVVDQTFFLGGSLGCNTVTALRVQPGQPNVLVASRGPSPGYTAAYDNGARRAAVLESSQGATDFDFGPSSNTLYLRTYSSSLLATVALDATGLHIQDNGKIGITGGSIEFESGRVYGSDGYVFDPVAGVLLGRLRMFAGHGFAIGGVVANQAVGVKEKDSYTATLVVFDLEKFVPLWSVDVPLSGSASSGTSNVVRWGTGGFAFLSGDAIFVVDAGAAAGPTHPLRVDKYGTGGGTVSASAAGIAVGIACGTACSANIPAGTPVTLTAAANYGSVFAGWAGGADCLDGQVTMTAPQACTAIFNKTGTPGPVARRIPIYANDLAYDPVSRRLFASLPSSVGAAGNSIISIDPATGVVGTPIWVGSEPNGLALSSDGTALYVATDGSISIVRLRLPAGNRDLQFALRDLVTNSPNQMRVKPGNADVLVASTDAGEWLVAYTAGVAGLSTARFVSPFDFSPDGTRVYGNKSEDLVVMSLSSAGLQTVQSFPSALGSTSGNLEYEGGRIYLGSGAVVNAQDGTRAGTFGSVYYSFVVPESDKSTAFFLTTNRNDPSARTLLAYDLATFVLRWSVDIPVGTSSPTFPGSFVRWGATGVAFRENSAIIIADYAGLEKSALLKVVKAGLGSGTVSSASGIDCGPTCMSQVPLGETVVLTALPTPPWTFGGWSGDADCADGVVTMTGPVTCIASFTTDRVQFSDEPLLPRITPVKAVHITELRQRIDEVRARYGLPAMVWTETLTSSATTVKAAHLDEMRTALAQAYASAGRPGPTYSSPTIVARQTLISAAQIEELRAAVANIW